MIGTQEFGYDCERQLKVKWLVEFQNPKQYVDDKLEMLRNEMYIYPSPEEIAHLRTLKTEGDIDRAVKSIINRAWS